jgi:hypothetical protein
MSKIPQPRLANATPQYSAEQINQIIRTLEQIIQQLNSNFTQEVQDINEAEAWFFINQGSC